MEDMQKRAIFFDFDGTIADTIGPGVAIFNTMAREQGFLEITKENQAILREKGPREAMKFLEIPALKVPMVVRGLRSGVREAMPTLKIMDGMDIILADFKRRGYFLGIVTSNSKANVKSFLDTHRIDFFEYIRAGRGVFRKTYAIKMALFMNGLSKEDVMFVGDEIRDIEAAKKVGMTAVAVTWGINSREGLLRANPDFIVDTAQELLDLLN